MQGVGADNIVGGGQGLGLTLNPTGPSKFAFVVPRYFQGMAGGAETLCAELAFRLAERLGPSGYLNEVEILSTCAIDNRTWNNHYEPGSEQVGRVTIRRFAVDDRNLETWIPLQIRLSQRERLTVAEELDWMAESVNSKALYEYLLQHGQEFAAIFFAPYLFGTTFWGSMLHPERSVLIPCLHDESYAYTAVVRSMFEEVRGAIFNTEAERRLAQRLYGPIAGGVVGIGFDPASAEDDALEPYFKERFPYVLYVGRKETCKNVQLLVDYFIEGKESSPALKDFKLVILGGGDKSDVERPQAFLREDVIDLQHLPEQDKRRIIKGAFALCQPSTNESFSIVLMEAWRLGVPVLVHEQCAVTKEHALKSGGGLYFSDADDFVTGLELLQSSPELRTRLGQSGRTYVEEEYNWAVVMKRLEGVF